MKSARGAPDSRERTRGAPAYGSPARSELDWSREKSSRLGEKVSGIGLHSPDLLPQLRPVSTELAVTGRVRLVPRHGVGRT